MDNLSIDITSEGRESLAHALTVVWPNAAGGKATHYRVVNVSRNCKYYTHEIRKGMKANVDLHQECPEQIYVSHHEEELPADDGSQTLILLWHEEQNATPLPYPLTLDKAISFVADWLSQADYGSQPDHDGSNGKGWRLFTNDWGHVAGHHYGIVGVQPAWAMYGK